MTADARNVARKKDIAMLKAEVNVEGPFAGQPFLVKAGGVAALGAFLLLGVFVPVALGVGVIAHVGKAEWNGAGIVAVLALTLGMLLIGAWCNCGLIKWLSGGRVNRRARLVIVSAFSGASAAAAALALAAGLFSGLMITVGATILGGFLLAWLLTALGQAFGRAKR